MTASEPLTLEEEYENQISWHDDEKSMLLRRTSRMASLSFRTELTFIILDKSLPDTPGTGNHGGQMAGDVNLFFHDDDDPGCAEINVMIAAKESRRCGWRLLRFFAVTNLIGEQKRVGQGSPPYHNALRRHPTKCYKLLSSH